MNGRPWTEVELECLRRWYATEQSETIAQALGRTVGMVYQKAHALGLRKDIEVQELDCEINDPAFAEACAHTLLRLMNAARPA